MRHVGIVSVLVSAALLAGCGGGGSSVPAGSGTANGTGTSAVAGNPIATANLTIQYPTAFHQAQISTSGTARSTPKFVDPSAGNYLDVWVDGSHVVAPSIPNVVPGGNGTQTFSLPIYAATSHQIVAIESSGILNAVNSDILSVGESDISPSAFQPGDSFAVGLTMQMNVESVGFMTDNIGSNALTGNLYTITCIAPPTGPKGPIFPFAADHVGGFVTNGGLGSVTPIVTNWTSGVSNPSDSLAPTGNTQNPGYIVTFNNTSFTGVDITLNTLNPAYTVQQDVLTKGAGTVYPGLAFLNNNNQIPTFNTGGTISTTFLFTIHVHKSC
jgi:hypothetical protein